MKRVKGAYFSGPPYQRARAHVYADCGFITGNVYEVPLYQDREGGDQLFVYTTLNVKGVPFGHKNSDLGPRTVPVKQCVYCTRKEEREDARVARRRR